MASYLQVSYFRNEIKNTWLTLCSTPKLFYNFENNIKLKLIIGLYSVSKSLLVVICLWFRRKKKNHKKFRTIRAVYCCNLKISPMIVDRYVLKQNKKKKNYITILYLIIDIKNWTPKRLFPVVENDLLWYGWWWSPAAVSHKILNNINSGRGRW